MGKALTETIVEVRERIRAQSGSRRINEQNTKAALIEPILRALGWDLEDLDEVQREYKQGSQDNPVDYSLFIRRNPKLFVEAKALGEDIDDRKWASQLMGYASVAGVEWVLLTNGSHWRIYNSHAAVPVEEKIFRSVNITEAEPKEFAQTLELLSKVRLDENEIEALWQAQFVDRQIQAALQDAFGEELDASIVKAVRQRTQLPLRDVKAGLSRARLRFDFPGVDAAAAAKTPAEVVAEHHDRRTRQERAELKRQVAAALTDEPIPISDLAQKVRLSVTDVRSLLRELRDDGAAVMSGAGKGARWSARSAEASLEASRDAQDVEMQTPADENDMSVVELTS